MKKLLPLILSFVLGTQNLIAQKESWNWHFGDHASLNFSSGSPVPVLTSAMYNIEGVASISDSSGNLLFYSNGVQVYDATNTLMPNGYGLLGHPSSSQGAVILKQPMSNSIYYVFTVDYLGSSNGLNYSVIDRTLNNGNGDIILKNSPIRLDMREKLMAVKHSNQQDYWIVGIDWASDSICAYLFDSTGINLTPVMSFASDLQLSIYNPSTNRANGYMKSNRQGNRFAMGMWNANSFDLFDFDNSTGVASNHIKIQGDATTLYRTYGVEFSPDGSKLYGTTGAAPFKLLQFDLNAGSPADIFNSRDTIAIDSTATGYYFLALQLGPDGKIYVALNNEPHLGVINFPDLPGAACGYVNAGINLGGKLSTYGLPNFPADYVLPITTSLDDPENISELKVYPNPANDYLTVQFSDNNFLNTDLLVIAMSGKAVLKTKIQNTFSKIAITDLAAGMYFVQLNNGSKAVNRKLTIVR